MTTKIQAIPTRYAGCHFRSTLEADWACTLDAYGIAWQYEPEAYQLPSGAQYRPDFYLPEITTWLEVKGPHNERLAKAVEMRWAVACSPDCPPSCPEHARHPWRMFVIGGPADKHGRIQGYVPGVSSTLARCDTCGRTQWTTVFVDTMCRACASVSFLDEEFRGEEALDTFAHLTYNPRAANDDCVLFGLNLHRAPR